MKGISLTEFELATGVRQQARAARVNNEVARTAGRGHRYHGPVPAAPMTWSASLLITIGPPRWSGGLTAGCDLTASMSMRLAARRERFSGPGDLRLSVNPL